jgi:hypothetical protein
MSKIGEAWMNVDFKEIDLALALQDLYHAITENGNEEMQSFDVLGALTKTAKSMERAFGVMKENINLLAALTEKQKQAKPVISQEEYETSLLEELRSHFSPSENEKMDDLGRVLKSLRRRFCNANDGYLCDNAFNCPNRKIRYILNFGDEIQLIDIMLKRTTGL